MCGPASSSRSSVIGISGITIVVITGEIGGLVIRIEDINTTCVNPFIREWIIQLLFCWVMKVTIGIGIIWSQNVGGVGKGVHCAVTLARNVSGSGITTHRDVPVHVTVCELRKLVHILFNGFTAGPGGRRARGGGYEWVGKAVDYELSNGEDGKECGSGEEGEIIYAVLA